MAWQVIHADCIEAMRDMDAASVDAIVTDPPYGLEFMGKEWDAFRLDDPGTARHRGERAGSHGEIVAPEERTARRSPIGYGGGKRASTYRCIGCGRRDQFRNEHGCSGLTKGWRAELIDPHAAPPTMLAFGEWCRTWALEALRVLKPGAHLLAFGGTRTFHRLTCALEDAGFEIRDCLSWLYGSGFPKSLDVSKAIDKAAGAERDREEPQVRKSASVAIVESGFGVDGWAPQVREAVTEAAQRWQGWGTALKPAWEPIVMARKPLVGSVAANVRRWRTGALNIDGTRIGFRDDVDERESKNKNRHGDYGTEQGGNAVYGDFSMLPPRENYEAAGRWPANAVLDPEAAEMLDEQTGETRSRIGKPRSGPNGDGWGMTSTGSEYDDLGGASRFFYVPKADREERDRGLEHRELIPKAIQMPSNASKYERQDGEPGQNLPSRNVHPTVKPLALMQWLVRMVTPPGGTVLDPFTGSGSTGIAALREGFAFVGIEREADYVEIARDRIIGDAPLFNVGSEIGA